MEYKESKRLINWHESHTLWLVGNDWIHSIPSRAIYQKEFPHPRDYTAVRGMHSEWRIAESHWRHRVPIKKSTVENFKYNRNTENYHCKYEVH